MKDLEVCPLLVNEKSISQAEISVLQELHKKNPSIVIKKFSDFLEDQKQYAGILVYLPSDFRKLNKIYRTIFKKSEKLIGLIYSNPNIPELEKFPLWFNLFTNLQTDLQLW